MAIFNTQKLLKATTSQIPDMTEAIRQEFLLDGYEVNVISLVSGGSDISVTKGGLFKAVLGMRSAMKINLTPQLDGVFFDTHVGIFGQQAIPTVITMFFFWPVLITQIWGMIKQSNMDERALAAAERAIPGNISKLIQNPRKRFCTECGMELLDNQDKCPNCGK